MCGLVGMAGYLEPAKHRDVMKDMLILDTLRGRDSTGISCVDRERSVATRKLTVPGWDFVDYPIVDRAMKFGDQIWMGHNRFKTTGEINRANAHPFEVMDDEGKYILLVGAHNGTLNNKYELERRLDKLIGQKFDTDSETLLNLFVHENSFKEAIRMARGAWSLVFWDPTTNSLHFLRNKERPMNYAWSKDHKVLLWASEPWMMYNAARRHGMELEKNDKGISCFQTLEDHLYTLEIPQGRDQVLPDMAVEGGYAGAPAQTFPRETQAEWRERMRGMFGGDGWWGQDDDPNLVEERKTTPPEAAQKGGADNKTVVTLGYPPQAGSNMRGFNGQDLDLKAFAKVKKQGCVWCKKQFEKNEPFVFIDPEAMICKDCDRDTHAKGDCVRPDIDYDAALDDDLPFDLAPPSADTSEGRKLIAQSVRKQIG